MTLLCPTDPSYRSFANSVTGRRRSVGTHQQQAAAGFAPEARKGDGQLDMLHAIFGELMEDDPYSTGNTQGGEENDQGSEDEASNGSSRSRARRASQYIEDVTRKAKIFYAPNTSADVRAVVK
jgi:hypothetical protein